MPGLAMEEQLPQPEACSYSQASSSFNDNEPNTNQKLFLVVSVALATVCFFTNVVQVAVFGRPSTVRSVKSVLLLSQAMSGLLAAFVVAFPIHVIAARGGWVIGEGGYAACYLGHSAVILVTGLTSLGTATLLLLDQYIKANHPRRYMTLGTNVIGWSVAVCGVWVISLVVALLPYMGWNSWEDHDARCHLSTLWPLSFTAFLCFILGIEVMTAVLMWALTRAQQLKTMTTHTSQHPPSSCSEPEDAPIAHTRGGVGSNNPGGGIRVIGWFVCVASVVPLLAHVVVASSCAASSQCQANPTHYHEDASSLPWSSLLLTAAAVTIPLLHVFTDDQVSSSTLLLLSRVCCWWCERRKQRLIPRNLEPHDAETNVYVHNDTDQLVGDN
ncbi:unnamed protein product [Meganyctiphanes norvegica]|uniref:G-protein coupled receptors family 1 profile domain-containing protein n=1 Tax=Meganyctiphanes norvegica TaxID=48144 RepID=A0AAV2QM16_MEGNR